MSDEDLFSEDEEVISGDQESGGGRRRIGLVPGIVIQVLKWTGVILGAIIFIVTVVVITMNIMLDRRPEAQTRVPQTEAYQPRRPPMDWYAVMGEGETLRGTTDDQPRRTFIVRPHIGYPQDAGALLSELTARRIEIREIVSLYFSSRSANELQGAENRERVKRELRSKINDILIEGRIQEVAFDEYQIVEF